MASPNDTTNEGYSSSEISELRSDQKESVSNRSIRSATLILTIAEVPPVGFSVPVKQPNQLRWRDQSRTEQTGGLIITTRKRHYRLQGCPDEVSALSACASTFPPKKASRPDEGATLVPWAKNLMTMTIIRKTNGVPSNRNPKPQSTYPAEKIQRVGEVNCGVVSQSNQRL